MKKKYIDSLIIEDFGILLIYKGYLFNDSEDENYKIENDFTIFSENKKRIADNIIENINLFCPCGCRILDLFCPKCGYVIKDFLTNQFFVEIMNRDFRYRHTKFNCKAYNRVPMSHLNNTIIKYHNGIENEFIKDNSSIFNIDEMLKFFKNIKITNQKYTNTFYVENAIFYKF